MIPADARTGTTVGKYRLHEIVGRGGMGVVYRGEHVYIGKEVAVKILHEGYGGREESIKRFLREARAASLINHPNIVDVTDFGKSSDGTVFFVMELLEGEALDVVLQRDRRLDLMRAITIVNQMAGALGSAHSKGIVHRDLKPENVMLIRREGRRELLRQFSDDDGTHVVSEREKAFDFVKILDFGVAKVRDPDSNEGRVTQQGVVFGTPEYMAPETARVGISDPRTDIYALGIMFYEMLTGTVPFTGETPVDVMLKVVSQPVIPPRLKAPEIEITNEAERLIMKALSKDPLQRHQSMEELFVDLQQCYGRVRYRRQIELRPPETIPLQKVKRPSGSRPVEETPPGAATIPQETLGAQVPPPPPILLTKKKERKRTLPMEIGVTADSPKPGPTTASRAAVPEPDGPRWSDSIEAEEDADDEDTGDWSDIDIDAPDGTRG
ncbi:MAG TPA: serine/threonine-protein kinase [Polyangia bacterium]|nr:serine/threonine-protein kinase [Polyangia bacterium]